MNILFYKENGIIPEKGGISRITANLCKMFCSRGDQVWFVGVNEKAYSAVYDKRQFFLPDADNVDSSDNLEYITEFVKNNNINVIVNQNNSLSPHVDLLYKCKQNTGVKVVYCFHNSILTPVYNYPYTRQFSLEAQGKSWLFSILNLKLVRDIGVWLCIAKYYKNYRNIINKNDAIILLCEGQIPELERASRMRIIRNVHVIYNSMSSHSPYMNNRKKHVLWVGNFDYHIKRPDYMLKIWQIVEKQCPDWRLYMLGDGVSLTYCKRMASDMKLSNVIFTGRVNPMDYYRDAEILCTTSVHECFPMVLLEGMNNALALLAFDSFTSAKLLIEDGKNGELVKAFNIEEYAKSLIEVITNDDKRHYLQRNSLLSADRFCEDKVYSMWSKLLNEI